jgi:transposase-like protein
MQRNKEKPIGRRELTRRQEAALLAMIEPSSDGSPLSLSEISKNVGVNPSTLWRWRTQDELFKRKYRQMRRGLVEANIARLQSLMDKAISTLEKNLDSGNRPSEVRAAVTIVRQSIEGVDQLDYDERISKLERKFISTRNE